jgi:RND family efflux transporter MFP subunit
MKYLKVKNFAIITAYILFMASCQGTGKKSGNGHGEKSGNSAANITQDGHHHGEEIPALSFTIFAENYELFVEFPALYVNGKSRFLAHFTNLDNYKPVKEGIVKVYSKNNTANVASVNKPLRVGIFTPTYIPKKSGKSDIVVELSVEGKTIPFVIKNVDIFKTEHDAFHLKVEEHDGITYLKETSWFSDFAIEKIKADKFDEIIKCSGKILSDSKDEVSIIASTDGIFSYFDRNIVLGKKVRKGQVIGVISGGVIDNNIKSKYYRAKASYEEASENYNRAKKLVKEKIISQKQFAKTKADYLRAKSEFEVVASSYSKNGSLIYAPESGIISDLYIKGNAGISAGDKILTLRKDKNYMLKADMPKTYMTSFNNIYDANFKTDYSEKVFSVSQLGGDRIESSFSGKGNSAYIPVYFNLPKTEGVITGSFAEVYLKSNNQKDVITVPVEALMESNGNYLLYVQITGELFEERYVVPGRKDGYRVEILKGLNEGEYVVTKGTYKLKQASMSNAVPQHTH